MKNIRKRRKKQKERKSLPEKLVVIYFKCFNRFHLIGIPSVFVVITILVLTTLVCHQIKTKHRYFFKGRHTVHWPKRSLSLASYHLVVRRPQKKWHTIHLWAISTTRHGKYLGRYIFCCSPYWTKTLIPPTLKVVAVPWQLSSRLSQQVHVSEFLYPSYVAVTHVSCSLLIYVLNHLA